MILRRLRRIDPLLAVTIVGLAIGVILGWALAPFALVPVPAW